MSYLGKLTSTHRRHLLRKWFTVIFALPLRSSLFYSAVHMRILSAIAWSVCFQIKIDKLKHKFPIKCCSSVTTRHIPSIPTASYLCSRNSRFLGGLLSLLGFFSSPVNSQKKKKLMIHVCHSLFLCLNHCKSCLRSGNKCLISGSSPVFSTSLARLPQRQQNCMWQKAVFIQRERARRDPSLLIVTLAEITQYCLQIYWSPQKCL